MNNNQLPEQPSFISVHVGSRGRYYWDIKINIEEKDIVSNLPSTKFTQVVEKVKSIDSQLRQSFPNNAAEMKNTTRFGKFGNDDDEE